jgi:hypothetical protein
MIKRLPFNKTDSFSSSNIKFVSSATQSRPMPKCKPNSNNASKKLKVTCLKQN